MEAPWGTQNLYYSGVGTTADGTGDYKVTYIKTGPQYEDGYLSPVDITRVYFSGTLSLEVNQDMRIRVLPYVGQSTQIFITTPSTMKDLRTKLWPAMG